MPSGSVESCLLQFWKCLSIFFSHTVCLQFPLLPLLKSIFQLHVRLSFLSLPFDSGSFFMEVICVWSVSGSVPLLCRPLGLVFDILSMIIPKIDCFLLSIAVSFPFTRYLVKIHMYVCVHVCVCKQFLCRFFFLSFELQTHRK